MVMYGHSQNGWPAYSTTTGSPFVVGTQNGFVFWAANDDVKIVATELIRLFDEQVQSLAGGTLDDWSWAGRVERGSETVISNHASATAWDLNALQHPRGVRGTFSAGQVLKIKEILARLVDNLGRQVIRWGGLFTTVVDEMHFEVAGTMESVKQLADRLRTATTTPEDDDMKWTDQIPLTAYDAKIFGKKADGTAYRAGDTVSVGYMIKYPTELRRVEAELTAKIDELTALVKTLAPKST